MRLHLDWDGEEIKDMHLPAVLERQPAHENQRRLADFVDTPADFSGKWELWQSSGGEGYHYVEYDLDVGLEDLRKLRNAYGDDKLRVSLDGDRMRWGSPYVGVLYHMKQIRPGEHKPYQTGLRANLLKRQGFGADLFQDDGNRLDYAKILRLLGKHEDFGSNAAVVRKLRTRKNVGGITDPAKRAYDIANARRKWVNGDSKNEEHRAIKKALRDYAEDRGLGHYSGGRSGERFGELAKKPTRSTFHEYLEVPDVEFGTEDFGEGDSDEESEWYPANIRTGTYGDDVEEVTLKQMHDRIASELVDVLSPGWYQDVDGQREWKGLELSRWDRAISLERDRPLDSDEVARYRQIFFDNQPGTPRDRVFDSLDVDPFGEDSVVWECIVYDDEDAFSGTSDTGYFWIVRGVVDATDPDAIQNPIANSTLVCDTQGWLK